jgi:ribosomal protein L37AE/L43A
MNCEYCGASLSLTPDKTTLVPQQTSNCPKCANPVASGAWFCPKCGEVLTKDVEHLKQIQKKVLFIQEDIKKQYPEACSLLEPNEFIYFLFHKSGLLTNKYYVATDKRLLVLTVRKEFQLSQTSTYESSQALLSEIVTIGKPYFTGVRAPFNHLFKVQSFKETLMLDFGSDRTSQPNAWNFYQTLNKAVSDYTLQKRDIRAILCSLKVP